MDAAANVKVLAHSPGQYPILVVEISPGELRTLYFETGYDTEKAKPVTQDWLRENALGRHSFVRADQELPASALEDFVRRELLEED